MADPEEGRFKNISLLVLLPILLLEGVFLTTVWLFILRITIKLIVILVKDTKAP